MSFHVGIGKKVAWLTYNVSTKFIEALEELMHMTDAISDKSMEIIEYFAVHIL